MSSSSPSMDLDPAAILKLFKDGISEFYIVRYISIAACAWLFYDHILTASDEIDFVWKAPKSIAKFAFLLYRYATPTSVTLIIYATAGSAIGLTDGFCQRLVPTLSVLGVLFGCVADIVAVLHVSSLWKRNAKVFAALIAAFAITTAIAIVCIAIAVSRIAPTVGRNAMLNICTSGQKPVLLAATWGSGLLFDFVMLVFICLNAFDRPRDQRIPLARDLVRDGVGYFVVVTTVRIFNLIVTVAAPLWIFGLIATVSWPCFSINLSRFIFRLRSRRPPDPPQALGEDMMWMGRSSESVAMCRIHK